MSKTHCSYTKKRRLRYCSSTHKGLSTYPNQLINNNETYADMTNRMPRNSKCGMISHTHRHLIAYFVFDRLFIKSVLSFLCVKYKASIKRLFQYVTKSH